MFILLTGCTETCRISIQPVTLDRQDSKSTVIDGLMIKETCKV